MATHTESYSRSARARMLAPGGEHERFSTRAEPLAGHASMSARAKPGAKAQPPVGQGRAHRVNIHMRGCVGCGWDAGRACVCLRESAGQESG